MFILPDLPYDHDALAPVISEETMRFHHDKHHATYVETLNTLLQSSNEPSRTLEAILVDSASKSPKKLFNNAAQAWNHAFFWQCMASKGGRPEGPLEQAVTSAFGSMVKLRESFVTAGVDQFGSGWVWLASAADGGLKIVATHDADNTMSGAALTPLIVCDIWEHAYYLDYQNERKAYLEAWFDALPDWSFAARQFAGAGGAGQVWRYPPPESA